MASKLIKLSEIKKEDYFKTGDLVISKNNCPGLVLMCSGNNTNLHFGGTLLYNSDKNHHYKVGSYYSNWLKDSFKPYAGGIEITSL